MKFGKPTAATVTRTVLLVLAIANSALALAGKSPLPFDDDEALSRQVLRLLDGESLRRRLGENARYEAEQYALDRVLTVVMAQYLSVLPADFRLAQANK